MLNKAVATAKVNTTPSVHSLVMILEILDEGRLFLRTSQESLTFPWLS